MGECNNGMIIGHSRNKTHVIDGLFTSQLISHLPLLNATNSTLEGETMWSVFMMMDREIQSLVPD